MPTQILRFAGLSGNRLSGRIELPEGRVRGWALFAHCFACGKDDLGSVRIARGLAARGIGTLRFDFAGIGDSAGEVAGLASEVEDLISAAQAMTAEGMTPTLLVGHSLGGSAAIVAAARLPNIAAIATIAAPFDVDAMLDDVAPGARARIAAEGSAAIRLGQRDVTIGPALIRELAEADLHAALRALRRPLLILHSPQDDVVPIAQATRLFVEAHHPKSFVSLDPGGHLLHEPAEADYVAGLVAAWAERWLPDLRQPEPALDARAEETRAGKFQVAIVAGGARFLADEPVAVGGLGTGPSPYDLLSSSLAACTTMTLRLYADGKGWPVTRIGTAVGHSRDPLQDPPDLFVRRIAIEGSLSDDQRARMFEIADRCPVHRTLERGARVVTMPGDPPADAEPADAHATAMAQAEG